jgi:acyl-CoA synthetase (AMP-forming)/AMP-acid ligase II
MDLGCLRTVPYGGAPISEQTLLEAQHLWGNIMFQLYGQSEGGPATALMPRDHLLDPDGAGPSRLRSAGRPTPNSFVRIVDDDGAGLPDGEVGEIAICTPGNMRELWGDPDGTRERFLDGRWLRTRDLGYLDPSGYLYVTDRKEDMIISGGFNIWPAELENALYSHPAVFEAAVVGVPDVRWGETPKAVVRLRDAAVATEQELIDWCRQKVGSVKKPTSVEFVSEPLPKSPVGKILRRAIRERYWADAGRRISGS